MITKALTPDYRLRLGWSHRILLISVAMLAMAAALLLAGNRPVNSASPAPKIGIQEVRSTNAGGLPVTTTDFGAQKIEVPTKTPVGGCITPPADMVDWWPFDETSGTAAQDIAGSVNNAGTHVNGPTPMPGEVSGALCFDGVNDYVGVADQPEINFLGDCSNDAAEAFTIDAWVRPTQSSGLAVILDKRSTAPALVGYHLFLYNGRLGFQMAVGGTFTNFIAPASVAIGQWSLVTVTVTRCRGGQGRLYVNGNLVLSFAPLVGNLSNASTLNIGRRDPALGAIYFKGCIDELEIFKRALSDTEVQAIFQAGSLGKCKASSNATVTGVVVNPKNKPVQGVEVQVPGRPSVTTNAKGKFTLDKLAVTNRLAVSFSAPGFVDTTRVLPVRPGTNRIGKNVIVIWPRAAAVTLKAAKGGKVTFPQGGGLTIPPDSLVDKKGNPIAGKVRVSLTYLDVSDPNQIKTAPGDFTARMQDNTVQPLDSFGIFEAVVEDSTGRRIKLAPSKSAGLELPIPSALRGRAPRSVGLFSFDPATGQWIQAGTLALSEGALTYNGSINQTGTWNADAAYDTACITVQVFEPQTPPHGPPAANCYVEATGVTYSSVSSGYTDQNGMVCLVVKLNEQVSLLAFSTVNQTWHSQPVVIPTPSVVSGALGCIYGEKCSPVIVDLNVITDDSGRAPQVRSPGAKKRRP